jgi:protein-S-isoprenylcysteine O-methyltransferase Ste14
MVSLTDAGLACPSTVGQSLQSTVTALAYPTLACWALLEVGLRVREAVQGKGGRKRDRGTRVLIAISLGAAIGAASVARSVAPSLRTPAAVQVFGVIVMWLGLATRVWAVAALGGAFRTTVEVDPDQEVVASGPYRWIRHPSYAGLLLIVAGLGLALGNWLSVALCLVLPVPALAWRIHVEEAELSRVLGDAYRAYQARTARLIPGLW